MFPINKSWEKQKIYLWKTWKKHIMCFSNFPFRNTLCVSMGKTLYKSQNMSRNGFFWGKHHPVPAVHLFSTPPPFFTAHHVFSNPTTHFRAPPPFLTWQHILAPLTTCFWWQEFCHIAHHHHTAMPPPDNNDVTRPPHHQPYHTMKAGWTWQWQWCRLAPPHQGVFSCS